VGENASATLEQSAVAREMFFLIRLGVRSGGVVVGVEQVRQAAKRGTLVLAVVAPDASHHSRAKVLPLLAAKHVAVIEGPSAAALGSLKGRDAAAAVGVIDRDLAKGIRGIVERVRDA
jgi:ribosomal protein L7Ae-like RNA K-turn-binding protein